MTPSIELERSELPTKLTSFLNMHRLLRLFFERLGGVIVGLFGDDWRLVDIGRPRRRGRLPFQPGRSPRVRAREASPFQAPQKINERHEIAHREDRSARRREDVEELKLRRIGVVAARHPEITEDEL